MNEGNRALQAIVIFFGRIGIGFSPDIASMQLKVFPTS